MQYTSRYFHRFLLCVCEGQRSVSEINVYGYGYSEDQGKPRYFEKEQKWNSQYGVRR